MAFPCPDDCPDGVPYLDWIAFSQVYQRYLTYCALATAAANSPGPGPFQPLGVYTHTTDSTFVVPADASLVYWNVPGQSGQADIDFSLVQAGQEVTIVVIDSNGFNVTDVGATVFSLNDTSHRIQGIKSNGDGTITRITGTAAQYDVGASGETIALNSTNATRSGTLTQQGDIFLDGSELYASSVTTGPRANLAGVGQGWDFPNNNTDTTVFRSTQLALFGTADLLFQLLAGAASYGAIETGNNLGMILATFGGNVPIYIRPNRGDAVCQFDINGTLIATGNGVGGTRIAKDRTEQSVLVAGTVTVTDTSITAGSTVVAMPHGAGAGHLNVTISAGASFTITSSDGADTRTVSWRRTVPA